MYDYFLLLLHGTIGIVEAVYFLRSFSSPRKDQSASRSSRLSAMRAQGDGADSVPLEHSSDRTGTSSACARSCKNAAMGDPHDSPELHFAP